MNETWNDYMLEVRESDPAAYEELKDNEDIVDLLNVPLLIRKQTGISRKQLAKQSGISWKDLKKIDDFEADPSCTAIISILGCLNLKLSLSSDHQANTEF